MARAAELVAPGVAAGLVAVCMLASHGCSRHRADRGLADAAAPVAAVGSISEEEPTIDENVPRGNLSFEVVDAANGRPIPARLTFIGTGKTPSPRFTNREIPIAIDGGIASYNRVFSLSGHGGLKIPHGIYDVTVSRGIEWSLGVERGVHIGKTPVKLHVALRHDVTTPGLLSADLHVHAAPSWDSVVPLAARVQEFSAEGVDLLVATDHNTVSDYGPLIAELGAKKLIGSVRGAEVSTIDWGHFGAFPMNPEPGWWVLHGVRMKGMKPSELLGEVRRHDPNALITVNHPRMGILGYFSRAGFDRTTATFLKPRMSFDFDAVEVMNGYQSASREQIDILLGDWFSLLTHGHRVTAVGNSDTHHMHYAIAGYPRNYVLVPDDRPDGTDGDALAAALKSGRSFFTTGPILDVDIGGKKIGETVASNGKSVTLHVVVRAASWIDVDMVRVLVDGHVTQSLAVPPIRTPERLRADVPISVTRDAFVVVVADGGKLPAPIGFGPGHRPIPSFAVSNPIYIDVDGNGHYDAPMK
jgi:hypothetical protein